MRAGVNYGKSGLAKQAPLEVPLNMIEQLHFPKEDVLTLSFDKNQRTKDLQHANILGNVYQTKVSLLFEDIEGTKVVKTTVAELTEKDVCLASNFKIPVHRVVRVYY